MPILDKFGNEIEHHIDFPKNLNIANIEFGAGKTNFGKREYPKCYLTDKNYPSELVLHFKNHIDYKNEDCHYLDDICDFFEYKFERKFENIILCNPYKYGFYQLANAKKFFNRAGEILKANGRIHIIKHSSNAWFSKKIIENFFKTEIDDLKSIYDFELESFETLDTNHEINIKYIFHQTGLNKTTVPNEKIVIKKL